MTQKCKHIKRQAVASIDSGDDQIITVVCLRCGTPIYSYLIDNQKLEYETAENN